MALVNKNESMKISKKLPSKLESLEEVEKITEEIAKKAGLSSDERDNLAIAVTEVAGNAIVHGNNQHPEKNVTLEFIIDSKQIEIIVKDEGIGFNPEEVDDPLDPNNLLKESGRGIFILKSLMHDVNFDFTDHGTIVKMIMLKK